MVTSSEKQSWVDTLPVIAQREILDAAEIQTYQAGETVYRRGAKLWGAYTVQSGRFKAMRGSFDTDKFINRIVYPGESLGLAGTFSRSGAVNTIIAADDASLHYLPKTALLEIGARHPIVFERIIEEVGALVSRALGWIDFSLTATAPEKILWNLSHLSQFSQADPEGFISIDISQQEFARMLGLSRQIVNTELKRLVAENIVEMKYGTLRINEQNLRQAAASLNP